MTHTAIPIPSCYQINKLIMDGLQSPLVAPGSYSTSELQRILVQSGTIRYDWCGTNSTANAVQKLRGMGWEHNGRTGRASRWTKLDPKAAMAVDLVPLQPVQSTQVESPANDLESLCAEVNRIGKMVECLCRERQVQIPA
jgi:hypothetical protein